MNKPLISLSNGGGILEWQAFLQKFQEQTGSEGVI
jgi:hypothetical protein